MSVDKSWTCFIDRYSAAGSSISSMQGTSSMCCSLLALSSHCTAGGDASCVCRQLIRPGSGCLLHCGTRQRDSACSTAILSLCVTAVQGVGPYLVIRQIVIVSSMVTCTARITAIAGSRLGSVRNIVDVSTYRYTNSGLNHNHILLRHKTLTLVTVLVVHVCFQLLKYRG